jgi:hypothetical protein
MIGKYRRLGRPGLRIPTTAAAIVALSTAAAPVFSGDLLSMSASSFAPADAAMDEVTRALLGNSMGGMRIGGSTAPQSLPPLAMQSESFAHSRLVFPLLLAPVLRELPPADFDPVSGRVAPRATAAAASNARGTFVQSTASRR